MQHETVNSSQRKRWPWLATALSLLVPGLGQFYNGQFRKSLIFFLATRVMYFVLIVALQSFAGAIASLTFLVAIVFACCIDAYISARKIGELSLRPWNRWFIYVAIICLQCLLPPELTSHYEAFRIRSGSMEPTIMPGDQLIVDKRVFRTQAPQRNDVVTCRHPDDPSGLPMVKRVVAVAGDVVQVKSMSLLINGQSVSEPFALWLYGGKKDFGPVTVPAESVFVLGDNRDRSKDSRFWNSPFIVREHIIGKALYVYWPLSRSGTAIK